VPGRTHAPPAQATEPPSVEAPASGNDSAQSNEQANSTLAAPSEPGGSGAPREGSWGRGGPGGASPLEPLATAVRAGNVADANTAYNALNRSGRRELRTATILREYIELLPNADGLARLRAVRPSKDLWLNIANGAFAGANADLTTALQDNRITDGSKIVANVAAISRFNNLRAPAVLQPILNAAPSAANHGAVLADSTTIGLVQGGGNTFTVLTGLDDAKTRSAYERVEAARTWLNADLATLGTKIAGWGADAVGNWVKLQIRLGGVAQVETWYDAAVAAWQPHLVTLFTSRRPAASIKTTFVAGQTLAVKIIDSAAGTSTQTAAEICLGLGWQPTQGFERAIAGGWIDAAASATLAGRDGAMMRMLASTASIQAGLAAANVYIIDAFPRFSDDQITTLYQSNAGFKTAVESDPARYADLHARIPSIAPPAAPGAEPEMPVVDPDNPTPLDDLRTAVTNNSREEALAAYNALRSRPRRSLRTDPMLQPLVQLQGVDQGERILRAVEPARAVWLRIAATAFAGNSEALTRALTDNGITRSRRLAARVADVVGHAAYHTQAVLQPILDDDSTGGQGRCLASPDVVTMLTTAFAGQHVFQVLTALNSKKTIKGFKAHTGAQTWIEGNLGELATRIVGWATVGKWVNAVILVGKPQLVQQLYETNQATWLPPLRAVFARPSALVRATFVPGNAFAQTLIDAMGTADAAQGVQAARGLGWTPVQILECAAAGAWFSQATLTAVMPTNAAAQEAIANNAGILGAVIAIPLHPTVAFPQLVADSTKAAQIFRTNAAFQAAMLAPQATFEAYLATVRNLGPWVEGMLAANQLDRMLELAQATPRRWRNGVNASPGGIDAVLAALPAAGVPNNNAYQGLYAVFGPPASRSLAQCLSVYEGVTNVDLLPPGDRSIRYLFPGTAPHVTDGANQWELRQEMIGMAPTLAAMTILLTGMASMPMSAAVQTQRLMFMNLYEAQWRQMAPAASANWHNFTTPQMRDYGTSFAHNGLIVLRCDGRGGPIRDMVRTMSDGAGSAYGGGASARRRDRLTLFQNHAVHEFGHNVGRAEYPRAAGGTPLRGDDDAETWANWQVDTAAGLKGDYWNPRAPSANWRVDDGAGGTMDQAISADHVFDYLQTVLYTYATPGAGNDVRDHTTGWADAWRRINRTRAFKNTTMMKYMRAIGGRSFSRGNAFKFPGFTPPDPVHIFSTRWNNRGATYTKAAFDALRRPVGWYSLSSPWETFAEIYAKHYSGQATPDAYWAAWFAELDQSPAANAPPGAGNHPGGPAAGGAVAGEVEPPLANMRSVW